MFAYKRKYNNALYKVSMDKFTLPRIHEIFSKFVAFENEELNVLCLFCFYFRTVYNALTEFKLYAYLKWPFTIIVSCKNVIENCNYKNVYKSSWYDRVQRSLKDWNMRYFPQLVPLCTNQSTQPISRRLN